jgi:hypothetical protein
MTVVPWASDMKSLEETFVVVFGLSWGFMGFVLLGSVRESDSIRFIVLPSMLIRHN